MSEPNKALWKRALDKALGLTTSVKLPPSATPPARQQEALWAKEFPMIGIDKPADPVVLERTEAAVNARKMRNIETRMFQRGIPDTVPDVWPRPLTIEQSKLWWDLLEKAKAAGMSEEEARESLRRQRNVSIVPAGGGYRSSDEHPMSPFGTVQEPMWGAPLDSVMGNTIVQQNLYKGKKNLP